MIGFPHNRSDLIKLRDASMYNKVRNANMKKTET